MKGRRTVRTGPALALMLLAGPLVAQRGPLQRTEDYERLGFLVGEWETMLEPSNGSAALAGRMRFEWDVGGVWLIGHYSLAFPNVGTRNELAALTFDTRQGAYVGYLIDNLSARVTNVSGEWVDDARLLLRTPPIASGSGDRIVAELMYSKVTPNEVHLVQRQSRNGETPVEVARVTLRRRDRTQPSSSVR